jgi:outer membrane protein assembly factor BamB/5-hydroxyisourate hydrolase-like protein (transthyretin family)
MKKQILFLTIITLLIAGLSGCTEQPSDGNNNGGGTEEGFQFPSLDTNAALPEPPISGETHTLTLSNLEITYYDAVASNGVFSLGADLFIHVKNIGTQTETLYVTPIQQLAGDYVPEWNLHFFSYQDDTIILQPYEEKTLRYFASMDDAGEFTVSFDFWQNTDQSDKITATVTFYSTLEYVDFPSTALVYGYVLDKDTKNPLQNVDVQIQYYNGRETIGVDPTPTDNQGRYVTSVPSIEDMTAYFGQQELAYSSIAHFMTVRVEGYEFYYQDEIAPERGEHLRIDVELESYNQNGIYMLDWEKKVSDYYGFFWIKPDVNWEYIVASQAKHPPEIDKPTNFYLYNVETGEQLWNYPTGKECWGIDITDDGTFAAAGSHDNYVYVVNTNDGSLKWKKDSGSMNRWVEFSHDGSYLLTGPAPKEGAANYDFVLYNVADGTIKQGFSGYDLWLRNAKFSNDDSKFVVGLSEGYLAMFNTNNGDKIWDAYVGEFPLFLAVDENDNTYACGKGRTMFSFDSNGNLRWSYRVPDHTTTSGAITPDGSRIVIGTVGAWLYYINGNTGDVLWRTRTQGENVGHNAISISEDGKCVAVGIGPNYYLTLYNEKGTKLFLHDSEENDDPILDDKWATIGAGASTGTQKGIMCTITSPDGDRVIAAYGDNYIRAFKKQ